MMKCKCGGTFVAKDEDELVCDRCSLYTTFMTEFVGMCGCGSPAALRELVLAALRMCSSHKCGEWIGESIEREFVIHTLNDHKLLEHGSSAIFSWTTELGDEAINYLSMLMKKGEKRDE